MIGEASYFTLQPMAHINFFPQLGGGGQREKCNKLVCMSIAVEFLIWTLVGKPSSIPPRVEITIWG